jgi:hypothetical protein
MARTTLTFTLLRSGNEREDLSVVAAKAGELLNELLDNTAPSEGIMRDDDGLLAIWEIGDDEGGAPNRDVAAEGFTVEDAERLARLENEYRGARNPSGSLVQEIRELQAKRDATR